MTRGEWGRGSVRAVKPGVWEIVLSVGNDPVTGKRRQIRRRVHGKKADAVDVLEELHQEHGGGRHRDMTLGELIAEWRAHATHAPSTSANYDRAVKRIPRAMLDARADSIRSHDVRRMFTSLSREHGAHALTQIRAVMSGAYTAAVDEWDWFDNHPVRPTPQPTIRKRTDTTPPPEAIAKMIELVRARDDHPDPAFAVWFRIVVVTGARSAEVVALRWCDLDLKNGRLTIANSVARTVDRGLQPPKNDASHRTIPLDAGTVAELRAWKKLQAARSLEAGTPLVKDAFVLSHELDGSRPIRPDTGYRRFKKIAVKAGYPNARLHDMRHAAATIMLDAGVPPKTVQQRLGHTRITTTMDLYGHVLDASARAAADVLGELAN